MLLEDEVDSERELLLDEELEVVCEVDELEEELLDLVWLVELDDEEEDEDDELVVA